MSLAGAPRYWLWRKIGGTWDQALPFAWTKTPYPQRPWGDMHRQTGAPEAGFGAHSQSANPTGIPGQQFNVPHLPPILEWYLSLVSTMYHLGRSQYRKSDRCALNSIQYLELLVFADRFWGMDCWAIDPPMVYLQEHLLMPADNRELQWLVAKLHQPSSTSLRKRLARESLWIGLPLWTFGLPQK